MATGSVRLSARQTSNVVPAPCLRCGLLAPSGTAHWAHTLLPSLQKLRIFLHRELKFKRRSTMDHINGNDGPIAGARDAQVILHIYANLTV